MNRVSRTKLERLVSKCEDALRHKERQSLDIFRGDMWAIVSAVHELRKRGVLERRDEAQAGTTDLTAGATKATEE
jgi:hypothetical protein